MKNFIPDNVSQHDNVFDVLKERGFIEQVTDEDAVREMLGKEKIKFYIGFDPTADCLHVGHFMQVIIMMYMQKYGHTPVVLLGGGTGMVGDPSGRQDMRKMMDVETIDGNCAAFKKLFDRFLDFDDEWKYEGNNGVYSPGHQNREPIPGKAISVNNGAWLRPLNYVEFVREVGTCFNVNNMLRAECFKQRMEQGGLSFFEFNYMLMQGYDFTVMARDFGVKMQFGGNDQWSNIIGGVELIRKKEQKPAYGLTFKLLTTSEGIKMGKTMKGAVWLDPEKTSPYEFYQYWRNIEDVKVEECLGLLTFLPMDEVRRLGALEGAEINKAKEVLAYEITKIVHGEEEAKQAQEAARAIFAGGAKHDDMPTTTLEASRWEAGIDLISLLVEGKMCATRSEARRQIQQGGVSINDVRETAVDRIVTNADKQDGSVVIRKGKKVYHQFK